MEQTIKLVDLYWAVPLGVLGIAVARAFLSTRDVLAVIVVCSIVGASLISTVQAGLKQAGGWNDEAMFLMLLGIGSVGGGAWIFDLSRENYRRGQLALAALLLFCTVLCAFYSAKTDFLQLASINTSGQGVKEDAAEQRETATLNRDLEAEAKRDVTSARAALESATTAVLAQAQIQAAECATGVGPKCRSQTALLERLEQAQRIAENSLVSAEEIASDYTTDETSETPANGATPTKRASQESWQQGIDDFATDQLFGFNFRVADAFFTTAALNMLAMMMPSLGFNHSGPPFGTGGYITGNLKRRSRLRKLLTEKREARADKAAAEALKSDAEQIAATNAEIAAKAKAQEAQLQEERRAREAAEAEAALYRGEVPLKTIAEALERLQPDELKDVVSRVQGGNPTPAIEALLARGEMTDAQQKTVRLVYDAAQTRARRAGMGGLRRNGGLQ